MKRNEELIREVERLKVRAIADRELTAAKFFAAETAVQAALSSAEKAVEKANTASEKRFDAVNEFRGQLNDMMITLIPRNEAEARFNDQARQISEMKSIIDKGFTGTDTRMAVGKEVWAYVVGGLGLLAMVLTAVFNFVHH
jgi:hypothetical protein